MDCTRHYDSPLGGITLAGDGEALTGLWFDGQEHFAETLSAGHEARNPSASLRSPPPLSGGARKASACGGVLPPGR